MTLLDDETLEEEAGDEQETSEDLRKRLKSEYAKGAQKLVREKATAEKEAATLKEVLKAIPLVSKDPNYLLELAKENPEAADKILAEYYNGVSIEDFEQQLTGSKDDTPMDADSMRKQIRAEVEQSVNAREVKKEINSFIEKAGLDEETQEKFDEQFKDLIDGKRLNTNNVSKYLKIAFAETVGYEKADNMPVIAKAMSAGGSAGGAKTASKDEALVDDMRNTMKNMRF